MKIFAAPESYKARLSQFNRVDAIISLTVIALYFLTMALSGLLMPYLSKDGYTIFGSVVNMLFVAIVIFAVKMRKQDLDTIGLKAGNIKLSMIFGGILAGILFFCNCLSNVLFENQSFISLPRILFLMVYFFTVGLSEEVLFRGYLFTRLHALTKHIWIDALLAALLFVLMHFPFRMVGYHMTFWEIISNTSYMADLFITALILTFIRVKSDSLYGAILPHWVSDWAYAIVTHM